MLLDDEQVARVAPAAHFVVVSLPAKPSINLFDMRRCRSVMVSHAASLAPISQSRGILCALARSGTLVKGDPQSS
jgi:hypothetical protein